MVKSEELTVTLALPVTEVRMGDVVDHLGGRLLVREIVQHADHRWELAGDPPSHPGRRPGQLRDAPSARRTVGERDRIRVWRPLTAIGPVRGHGRRTVKGGLVVRGWYRRYSEFTPGCSCGWTDTTTNCESTAELAWRTHKTQALTQAAVAEHGALGLVSEREAEHGLPPVPWTFKPAYSGPGKDGSIASGTLDGLPLEEARSVLRAWADVLVASGEVDGLPLEEARSALRAWAGVLDAPDIDEHRYDARTTVRGKRAARTDLRLGGYGVTRSGTCCIVQLTASIPEPAPPQPEAHMPPAAVQDGAL